MRKFNNEGRELSQYIENERQFIANIQAIKSNYSKKIAKGKYNKDLAFKGIRNILIPLGAKGYCKEFGGIASQVFSKEARDFAAWDILDSIEDDILND